MKTRKGPNGSRIEHDTIIRKAKQSKAKQSKAKQSKAKQFSVSLPLAIASIFTLASPAQASLTAGTAAGKSVVYDNVTNITWTADANLLGTLENTLGYNTVVNAIIAASPTINDTPNSYTNSLGIHNLSAADFNSFDLGRTTWFGAKAFTTYLNSINYGGSNQWVLPSAGANPQFGFNQTGTQFGELFYNGLGGTAGNNIPNTSTFTNEQIFNGYWLGSGYVPDPRDAWIFDTFSGYQNTGDKGASRYAWVVSPGNLTAVPVPGALWLFGSAMLSLIGISRRQSV